MAVGRGGRVTASWGGGRSHQHPFHPDAVNEALPRSTECDSGPDLQILHGVHEFSTKCDIWNYRWFGD